MQPPEPAYEDAESAVGDMLDMLGGDPNREAELLISEGWQEDGQFVDDGGWGEVLDTFTPKDEVGYPPDLGLMSEDDLLASAFGGGYSPPCFIDDKFHTYSFLGVIRFQFHQNRRQRIRRGRLRSRAPPLRNPNDSRSPRSRRRRTTSST